MYYQKEENNNEDEEISQNESSEELKELTENNNRSKNEVIPNNHINDEYSQKKNIIYIKDDVTEELSNSNNMEEKRENSNLKYENEKLINIKEEKEDYTFDNYKRKSENSNLFQTFYTNKSKQQYEENTDKNYNYSSRIINNEKDNEQKKGEYEFKAPINNNKNNNKNNLDSNREGKNTHHLNFSYEEGENFDKENYNINSNRNINLNNNNLYDEKDRESNNEYSNDNTNEDYNNDKNDDDKNINIGNVNENMKKNKNNNLNNNKNKENKVNDDYKKYLEQKNNFIPIDNKENIEIDNNIEQKEENFNNNENKNKDTTIKVNKIKLPYKNEVEKPTNEEDVYQPQKQIIRESDLVDKESNDTKNFYYFCYDNSINIRNYSKKTGKTEYSTEQSTINKKYLDNNNMEVKEFKPIDNTIEENEQTYEKNEEKIENNIIPEKKNDNYTNNYLNYNDNKENNTYINYNKKMNNNENINNNNNDYKNINKIKYINDINNVNIYNNYDKKETKNIIENNINNEANKEDIIKENDINISNQNIDNNINDYNNLINNKEENINEDINNTNKIIEKQENIIDEPDNNNPEINNYNNNYIEVDNNITHINDSMNLNTLESIAIKRIEEEDEKMTMEIEQEAKRLNELEKEKLKLILEETERRQKILEEIERQEKKEKEKKKIMRKKYEESLRKKKQDEEKLKKIKMEQERQLKEINELIYKRQIDEQKLLLLTEGKLNKQQRKNYRNLIRSENKINQNKLPFDILMKDNHNYGEKDDIIRKMKNHIIDKDSKLWNLKDNKIDKHNDNHNKFGFRNNYFKNKKISYENPSILYQYYTNYNSKENTINNDKARNLKNKNDKITINTGSKLNEYMSFSPTINYKKNNFNLSPPNEIDNNNKLNTELHQIISFSPMNKDGQDIKKVISRNSNYDIKDKNIIRITGEDNSNSKVLYQKKIKKNHKNINNDNDIGNSIDKNYEKKKNKNLSEKSFGDKDIVYKSNNRISFNEIKELKDITSKMANEVEKKIEIINKNQYISKAKSSPKFNPYLEYSNSDSYQNNYNKNINEKYIRDEDENKKMKNTKLIKEQNNDLINLIDKKDKNITKQKSFIEEFALSNDIKKECLKELNKKDKEKSGKKSKENIQLNFGNSGTFRDNKYTNRKMLENMKKNKNKNRKEKIVNILKKENKNYNVGNQKSYYKEYLYGPEKSSYTNNYNDNFLSENNSRFLPYYKELYE